MSKLIIGDDGYPRFPDTTADLRWVDKAIPVEEILKTTATPFLTLVKSDIKMAESIIDARLKTSEKNGTRKSK